MVGADLEGPDPVRIPVYSGGQLGNVAERNRRLSGRLYLRKQERWVQRHEALRHVLCGLPQFVPELAGRRPLARGHEEAGLVIGWCEVDLVDARIVRSSPHATRWPRPCVGSSPY